MALLYHVVNNGVADLFAQASEAQAKPTIDREVKHKLTAGIQKRLQT